MAQHTSIFLCARVDEEKTVEWRPSTPEGIPSGVHRRGNLILRTVPAVLVVLLFPGSARTQGLEANAFLSAPVGFIVGGLAYSLSQGNVFSSSHC